jgi:hypothetical protein
MPSPRNPLRPATVRGSRRGTRAAAVLVSALCLALAAAPTTGAVYKWVDANGRVVYSDQPPPPSVKGETMRAVPPPDNPNAARELEDQEFARKEALKKKAEAAAAADKARTEAEQRREVCVTARGQLAMLLNAQQPMFRANEKGERVPVNDQMRRDDIDRTQQVIRDNCKLQ